ncbi:MAG: hypothetical protein B7X55_09990 [Rhodobacterales bacterium 34-62-10]|nr:MAG: hypothetical protein B7X55_09990 [Rhodobacterales bacterium 34-62-10]
MTQSLHRTPLLPLSLFALLLAGCAELGLTPPSAPQPRAPEAAPQTSTRPPLTGAPRSVDDFDQATEDERQAAVAPPSAAAGSIGTTVASLGDPARPGFWMETPLVSTPTKGSVVYRPTGRRLNVDLIPIEGPSSGGSRLSLSAMRMLDAPLTGLPQVDVFTN